MFAGAADHRPSAITTAEDECTLQNGRENNNAFGLIQNVAWDIVRDAHYFLHDGAGILQTFLFPIGGIQAASDKQHANTKTQSTKHREPPHSACLDEL